MKLFSWERTIVRFGPVIVLAILFYLTGCASSSDVVTDTTLKTPSTVPGEKSSDEPMGAAPAGPGSAGVKW
jgi:hypothetical protein